MTRALAICCTFCACGRSAIYDVATSPLASTTSGGAPLTCFVDAGGTVTTLAGNGTLGFSDGTGGPSGTAEFFHPCGIAVDGAGLVYVADCFNNRIRKIDTCGNTSTFAGNGNPGHVDGSGGPNGTAELDEPVGVAVDGAGNVLVADYFNDSLRKIDPSGNVITLAGNGDAGWIDGAASAAEFYQPTGLEVGPDGAIYVADWRNNRVRALTPHGQVLTVAGNGQTGFLDGTGGPSGTAEFKLPADVAVDAAGNIYVADEFNNRIRKIDALGNVTTLAGNGDAGGVDGSGGPSGTAQFNQPNGVAVDAAGNIYVADFGNNDIRKIAPTGAVTTLAGNGRQGFADGTNGPSGTAELNQPQAVAVDGAGNVYVADYGNNRIRVIHP